MTATDEYTYRFPEGNPDCDESRQIAAIRRRMSNSNNVMQGILEEAKSIVTGPRQRAYGPPEINHSRTAQFWSTYLGMTITPRQVCEMNALQKLSRQCNGHSHDSHVDIIGFIANAAACEVAAGMDGT